MRFFNLSIIAILLIKIVVYTFSFFKFGSVPPLLFKVLGVLTGVYILIFQVIYRKIDVANEGGEANG